MNPAIPSAAAGISSGDANANRISVERYLDCLKTQRKLSPHTLDGYARDLRELTLMLDGAALASTTHAQVRNLAARLHARGLNPRSIARKLSAWRGYFGWLSQQTVLASNPVDGVTPPKRAKTLPHALGADDAVHLVSNPNPHIAADNALQLCT